MIQVIVDCKFEFQKKAKYVFSTLFEIMGIPFVFVSLDEINKKKHRNIIYYGNKKLNIRNKEPFIQIIPVDYNTEINNLESHDWKFVEGLELGIERNIAYLFSTDSIKHHKKFILKENNSDIILASQKGNKFLLSIDIIANAFFFLSLQIEKINQNNKNKEINCLQQIYKNSVISNPVVDQYINIFEKILKIYKNNNFHFKQYPKFKNNHKFALILSHDVDRIRSITFTKFLRRIKEIKNNSSLKKASLKIINLIKKFLDTENWTGNFDYIKNLENKYLAKSTFFVVSNPNSKYDPNYGISRKWWLRTLRNLIDKDFDIQLHGSYCSAGNQEILSADFKKLYSLKRNKISGIRFHYLQFYLYKTTYMLESEKVDYDSTLGFSDYVGYRCGTSFPYKLFNKSCNNNSNFYEIPLILMDTPFILENKMGIDVDASWKIIKKYLERSYNNGNCLTVNWHQSIINKIDITGFSLIYKKMLEWAANHDAWLTSPTEFIEWWKSRNIALKSSPEFK